MMAIVLTSSSLQVAVLKKLQGREHVCRFIGCGRNDRCQRQRHRQHHPCHHHHHQHHLHHNQLNHPHDAQVQLRGNAAAGKELGRTAKSATKGRFQPFHHAQVVFAFVFAYLYLYLCLRICFSSDRWKYKSHEKGIFSRSIELRQALQPTVFLWSFSTIFAFLSSTLFASG